MNTKITLFVISIFLVGFCFAQSPNAKSGGGEFVFNKSKTPCLTNTQREEVMTGIKKGIRELKQQNRLAYSNANRGSHPLFIWPIKKKDGLEYNDVWGISNYVDHNPLFPEQVIDYNGGQRTYDVANGYNHAGVDIFNWPFQWTMMDNDDVEIISAAPGQILAKIDSRTDRSCSLNGTNWNFVYIQHADGSVAVYGHLKQFSSTTKNVGDMVAEGEYLGIVGSSGNSTGPHLHFEVYSEIEWNGVGQDVLIDPYYGPSNSMNPDSWWQNQKPYNNPNINAALTHSAPPILPACAEIGEEITNESNNFDASDSVVFGLYMRDQVDGTSVNLKVIRPDNTEVYNWDFPFDANYYASYWYWEFSGIYNMDGQWKWEATYLGQTITHTFNIAGVLSVDEEDFENTSVYPNPFNDVIIISSTKHIIKANVVDILGKNVVSIEQTSEGIKSIDLASLSNGMYFLTLESDSQKQKTIKLIKD